MTPAETGTPSDPVIEALNAVVAESEDKIWRTNAMAQLTVRFGDGTFKKSALAAGDPELILKGVRAGKRAQFIFEFEPVDSRPFVAVEMDEKKVFGLLPGFEEHLVTGLGFGPDENGSVVTIGAALARLRRDATRKAKDAAESASASTASTEAERYAKNPLWGAF